MDRTAGHERLHGTARGQCGLAEVAVGQRFCAAVVAAVGSLAIDAGVFSRCIAVCMYVLGHAGCVAA